MVKQRGWCEAYIRRGEESGRGEKRMASIRRGWGMQEQYIDDFHLVDEEAAFIAENLDISLHYG